MRWSRILRAIAYLAVGIMLVIQLYPIVWVAAASLKTPEELSNGAPFAMPAGFYIGNYIGAFSQSNLLRYLLNSTVVAVLTIIITIGLGAPAAYAIEKLRFPGAKLVLGYFLLGIMIPIFVTLLPMFQMFNAAGLRNTYWALVLPQVAFGLPLCIYLYTGFMRQVPDALLEAATIDGAGDLRIFLTIVFPLCGNVTVTIVTLSFLSVWNEFVFANTFMTAASMKTLPIGLNDFVGAYGKTDFGLTYAAIMVSILPTLILYFFLNKRVISGVAAGATK
ncbi:MAG: carbohydrate ABC transporter permease [Bosea sp.]|nr:carbohydrate ABC transporter permease [Bosea sp. (in: a-proteobacteria)]